MYDVIIVGARCAGAPTAMLLARKGYRVLVVDRSVFPSEMRMSTHMIHQRGMAKLKKWGLLEAFEALDCPPVTHYDMYVDAVVLSGDPPPVDGVREAYAPRRIEMDEILVKAAKEAGAELREATTVRNLLFDGDRVCGIQGTTKDGTRFEERARLVIGADGPKSRVARSVGAPKYHERPVTQGVVWSYWSGIPMSGAEVYLPPYEAIFAWPTSRNWVMIGGNWTIDRFPEARKDLEGSFDQLLRRAAPDLAARVENGKREEQIYVGWFENFFRKPYGPGWALIGDAGIKKDPTTAQGITDSFLDADWMSETVDDVFSGRTSEEEGFAAFQERRDEWALPFFEFTVKIATFEPPPPEMLALWKALEGNPEACGRFFGVTTEAISPDDFFAPENIGGIFAQAAGG